MPNKPPPRTESLDARADALRLMAQVTRDGRMLSDASWLDGPRAARALRLAGLALRHAGRADAVLKPLVDRQPAPRIRDVLRLAMAEMFEDGAAPHGVVNDAVALARMSPKTAKQAGLVNALLRKIDAAAWSAAPPPQLPNWLRKHVGRAYGQDRTRAIEAAHLAGAPLDLTVVDDAADWAERLGGTVLPTGSVRLAGGQVSALPGFDDGAWWVQDAAAAVPARLLGDVAGRRVLDLCAAPGGKTMQLAAAGARVTALDSSDKRLRRLHQNLRRTGLEAEIVVADALDWDGGAFDAVLLDAPCTATGTIRRHPDLIHLRAARDVEALTTLQYKLLDRALTHVVPGGALVFCTCSLLPVEGEHQIAAALKRHPAVVAEPLDPADHGLPPEAASPHGLRLTSEMWSDRGGIDGFFMARLRVPG
ncbi:RsmB/NOP family class I SAM-dependent RNA methyltransferase [Jannaschia sp. LMIT008]|uniref:RsmB/NOP family class I SAM-dependent RNA methyltransferase n=1 Tax=Jannaschia maritima TaxID=3032585 RepID=UPI0028117860|nr:transcription antitermination factor NusB [Jannaschia sp. LMIT008]